MTTLQEAIPEIDDAVRQCFARHQFKTFGDALAWWHDAPYEAKAQESGSLGMSLFSTDILWLISQFGPGTKVDHEIMDTKIRPLAPLPPDEEDVVEKSPETTRPQKRRPRRRRRF